MDPTAISLVMQDGDLRLERNGPGNIRTSYTVMLLQNADARKQEQLISPVPSEAKKRQHAGATSVQALSRLQRRCTRKTTVYKGDRQDGIKV
jgi:hypothetical protein